MAPVSRSQVVFLEDYVNLDEVNITDWSPVLAIGAKDGNQHDLLAKLQTVPHLKAYAAANTPPRWHYRDNRRIMPIVALAEEGWTITTRERLKKVKHLGGNHGFDNNLRSMRATFIAFGPAFKQGVRMPEFPNIDVYDLLAYLLQITPAPNDGTLEVFNPALAKPK